MKSRLSVNRILAVSFRGLLVVLGIACTSALSAATVTRGPYLQTGTPNSVVVRWRTDSATDSSVRYGPAPGSLTSSQGNSTVTTEHEINVTLLSRSEEHTSELQSPYDLV